MTRAALTARLEVGASRSYLTVYDAAGVGRTSDVLPAAGETFQACADRLLTQAGHDRTSPWRPLYDGDGPMGEWNAPIQLSCRHCPAGRCHEDHARLSVRSREFSGSRL
jgi:hypothetical protein